MQAHNRVMINTIALYTRNVVNIIIALWSVPLILRVLGESDFGLYNLVAGVVSMLGFLNAAMTVSSQRYISVTMGKKDDIELNKVYNTSKILHFIIGVALVVILEICGLFLFDGFLNISFERIGVAKMIYQIILFSTFLNVISVPYHAIINAHEDLLVFSFVGICESLLKLLLAFSLYFITWDKLVWYAIGIAGITLFAVLVNVFYVNIKYKEMRSDYRRFYDYKLLKSICGFAGWNSFAALAMIGRNQGIAIVLNKFLGTTINATYGIANQINGSLSTFSQVLQQSINPQIMKSEGANDRNRMLNISYIFSKFSVLVISIMAVPLIVEMPYILHLWLGEYPIYTLEFSRLILLFSVIYQCSMGIMSAIQSKGQIAKYQQCMSFMILLNIPISILVLWIGLPPYFVIVGFICLEIATLFVRLLFARNLVGYDIKYFLINVVLRAFIPMFSALAIGVFVVSISPDSFIRLLITVLSCVATFLVTAWYATLNNNEKSMIIGIVKSVKNKI